MTNPNLPHIICILDSSGSMSRSRGDVINSFNNFVKSQREERGEALLTLIKFDEDRTVIHDKINFNAVPELTSRDYYCDNSTAMYDAIGETLRELKEKAYIIIQTDGSENGSRDYSRADIVQAIQDKKDQGVQFLFMGADIDVKRAAATMGLEDNTVEFNKSSTGIESAYNTMSGNASNYRGSLDTKKLYPASYKIANVT